MRKNSFRTFAKFVLVLIFVSFVKNTYSQTNYNCYINKISPNPNPNTLSFEIWVQNTGTTTIEIAGFQAGIDFNYAGIANGGTLTGSFVPGSNDPGLTQLSSPNVFIDPVSKQLRIVADDYNKTPGTTILVPTSNPIKIGQFNINNTVAFSLANPDFAWSYVNSSANKTMTLLLCYVNGSAASSVNITNPSNNFVLGNAVPTLSEWGLIILVILLIGTGATIIFKRQSLSY